MINSGDLVTASGELRNRGMHIIVKTASYTKLCEDDDILLVLQSDRHLNSLGGCYVYDLLVFTCGEIGRVKIADEYLKKVV